MKILVAGATGAIGKPLIPLLINKNYQVYGLTHSKEKAKDLEAQGVKAKILDVLDKKSVFKAVSDISPDIIIDMLTKLPSEYTPEAMKESAALNAKIRIEGGANLLEAGRANGLKKMIVQSACFYYAPGKGLADEETSFAYHASPGVAEGAKIYKQIEDRILNQKDIEGIALRFAFFYGPGTWFTPGGNVALQIQQQQFPIIGNGAGYWNFVHIEDAAKSIAESIQAPSGAYNIVADNPQQLNEWLPKFANQLHAKEPPHITEEQAVKSGEADSVYYATKLRPASNAKAKKVLKFNPRPFDLSK